MRYVIEGTWSGYSGSQRRVVHRDVHNDRWKTDAALRVWAETVGSIRYTDGTRLCLDVRDCKPRERVQEINGYKRLIRECFRRNLSAVEDLVGELP